MRARHVGRDKVFRIQFAVNAKAIWSQQIFFYADTYNMRIILHQTLKLLMKEKGVSAREVCRATGIAQSTYSGLLDGTREPSVKHLPKLAEYFQTSTDYLLTGKQSQVESMERLLTEEIFEGFLKVKIERVIRK